MGGYDASSSFIDIRGSQFSTPITSDTRYHTVFGVKCIEVNVKLDSDKIDGDITILEATAESQDDLVNAALEDEELPSSASLNKADPYGAVLWPASSAIAKYLLDTTDTLVGKTVLELGTGTGLVSLAAMKAGSSHIIATDYEDIPLRLLEHAEAFLNNNNKNDASDVGKFQKIETRLFDICNDDDKTSQPLPNADIVVAADIMYEPKTGRAMAHRAYEALRLQNSRVIIGDSPGRAGRPAFLQELRTLLQDKKKKDSAKENKKDDTPTLLDFTNVVGQTCTGYRHDLICGKDSTSISEKPQELTIAIMDLKPEDFDFDQDV